MNRLLTVTVILFLLVSFSTAQLHNSTKTLIHTQTGKTLDPGKLSIFTNMNVFARAGSFIGDNPPDDFRVKDYWLIAGNVIMSYGIVSHLDASLGLRLYQKTNLDNGQNIPDDVFLTLRAGSFSFARGHFQNALLTSFRFPVAEQHNYPFAEYASGSLEYGFMYAISYFNDAYFPQRGFSVHFNLGFWNHNESGRTFTFDDGSEFEADRNSKEIRMALATVFPTRIFDFRFELSGMLFETRPNNFIYSAEEWAFLTPSIRYKALKGLDFDLGVDIRLSPGDRQWTTASIPDLSRELDLPGSYPDWKIQACANFSFDLFKKQKSIRTVEDYRREEARQKIDFVEKVLEERESSRRTQSELESLRSVRKKTEREVEELKKIIDE